MELDFNDAPDNEWIEEDVESPEVLSTEESKSNKTTEKTQVTIKNKPINEDIDIPVNALGEMFLQKNSVMRDLSGCCYLYYPKCGYWKETSEKYLRGLMLNFDSSAKTTSARRTNAVEYALDRCSTDFIPWNKINYDEIPFQNCIYNITQDTKRDHAQENFLSGVIPHLYNKDSKCEAWLKCLETWFGKDSEKNNKIAVLQEFFGYVLCINAKYKKVLLLVGESNTGKSVALNVAEMMVGINARCCVPLSDMDNPQLLAPLKGALLNLVTEIGEGSAIADGGFKKVSANEPIQINQKFVKLETIIPVAKHIIATNNLPEIRDSSNAVYNRLQILQFNNVIDKPDPLIINKLQLELEGIIAWAVEGARRLIKNNGKFTTVWESEDIIKQYKLSQNPMLAFFEEGEFERSNNEDDVIPIKEFCVKFQEWKGGKEWTSNAIGRSLSKLNIKSTTKNMGSKVMRVYPKIKRKSQNESPKNSN